MINDNSALRGLCLDLMHADTEAEVIAILEQVGYWQDDTAWRWLGGAEHNYSTVGNQQSRAEQAIVEKLINSMDACLMAEARLNKCLPLVGNEPQAPDTPRSVAEARQRFFGSQLNDLETLSRGITVAATAPGTPRGGFKRPCFSIADQGEGQTPSRMPETILSLLQGNKDKIKFAQGKFNMGGTGVLEFCGLDRNLQFVLSKRHPELVDPASGDPRDSHWSFTVIRRNDPVDGKGSQYVYLAPADNDHEPETKGLSSFQSETMPIFPERNDPYKRNSAWGTIIKLYEYDASGFRTNVLLDGLMARTSIMLPDPPLPVRFHECRPFKGKQASYDTTMPGLITTLTNDFESDKRDNVEWYDQDVFDVDGEEFTLHYFLFKNKQAADRYRRDEGLVFFYNGQTHSVLTKDFFRRKSVKMDYLWQSLLVFVDCSRVSTRCHEQLFMNNRSQLRRSELVNQLERRLEAEIASHEELRELASERRSREISDSAESSESLAKAIQNILAKNKTFAALLRQGLRIRNPHRPEDAGQGVVGFIGRRFPTKFHIKSHDADTPFERDAQLETKVRITFETDAEDAYFRRSDEPGEFLLLIETEDGLWPAQNVRRPRLQKGLARMSFELPDGLAEGDKLNLVARIDDPSRLEPFVNRITLNIKPRRKATSGASGQETSSDNAKGADKGGKGSGHGSSTDSMLDVPNPIPVEEKGWDEQDPPFTKFTSVRIVQRHDAPEGAELYDFYINVDNCYLKNFMKDRPSAAKTMRQRFTVGMTLVALSLLHQDNIAKDGAAKGEEFPKDGSAVQDRVAQMTAAMAPFLLPMLDAMDDIQGEDAAPLSDSAGEAA